MRSKPLIGLFDELLIEAFLTNTRLIPRHE
jgi:hypothetical protein